MYLAVPYSPGWTHARTHTHTQAQLDVAGNQTEQLASALEACVLQKDALSAQLADADKVRLLPLNLHQ